MTQIPFCFSKHFISLTWFQTREGRKFSSYQKFPSIYANTLAASNFKFQEVLIKRYRSRNMKFSKRFFRYKKKKSNSVKEKKAKRKALEKKIHLNIMYQTLTRTAFQIKLFSNFRWGIIYILGYIYDVIFFFSPPREKKGKVSARVRNYQNFKW